jgi:hypothetical protein
MADTANEKLQDLSILNQHRVEEYKNNIYSTLLLMFKSMEKKILKEITIFYDEENVLQKDKVILLKKIKEIEKIELNKIKIKLYNDAEKYLGVQESIYKSQLENVFSDFSKWIKIKNVEESKLKKEFEKSRILLDKGVMYTLSSLWQTFNDAVTVRLVQNIESAYALEEKKKDFSDNVKTSFKTNENQLGATSALLIQQAYGIAIREMNLINSNVIDGYIYNAILDSRTSAICLDLNGGTYYYGHPELSTFDYEIMPPQHMRCRSFISSITKNYKDLGIPLVELSEKDKRYLNGESPGAKTYSQWFNSLSSKEQLEVLGKTRYDAYKKGDIKIEKFFSNGKRLTLSELRNKGII